MQAACCRPAELSSSAHGLPVAAGAPVHSQPGSGGQGCRWEAGSEAAASFCRGLPQRLQLAQQKATSLIRLELACMSLLCAAAVLGELLSSYEQREPLPAGQLHTIRCVWCLFPSSLCTDSGISAGAGSRFGLPETSRMRPGGALACTQPAVHLAIPRHFVSAGPTSTSASAASSRWRTFMQSWSAAGGSGASTPSRSCPSEHRFKVSLW